MLENGVNIRIVQELMGHADVKTTMLPITLKNGQLTPPIQAMAFSYH